MSPDATRALVKLVVTGVGVTAGFGFVVFIGARARLRPIAARLYRCFLAATGTAFISAVGWIFVMFGIHRSTPLQTNLARLGVPFLQLGLESNQLNTDTGVLAALLLSFIAWFLVLYALFTVVRIPRIAHTGKMVHGP
jgi:hypothetical protein